MYWYQQLLSIWIIVIVYIFIEVPAGLRNYGPYKLEYLAYKTCKGPKQGDCGVVRINSIRNMSNIPFILDFPKDCAVENARVVVGKVESNNKTKKLWNYQISKPCQHFVLGPLLNKSFNLSISCKITKGHHEVHINMNDLSENFLGSNFFYDTYFFKTLAYNKFNNFFCVYSEIKVMKS